MSDPNIVNNSEIGKDGIVLTEEDMDSMYKPLETHELPDSSDILNKIAEIMEFMCTDDMLKLKNTDTEIFNKVVGDHFKDFSERYPSIFDMVIRGDNLDNLLLMVQKIDMVKRNEIDMGQVETDLRDSLAEQYIYPNMTKNQEKKIRKKLKYMKK